MYVERSKDLKPTLIYQVRVNRVIQTSYFVLNCWEKSTI